MTDPAASNGSEEIVKASGDMSEIGGTGLVQYGGVLNETTLPQLRGTDAIATFKEMTFDPVVAGLLLAIDNLVRQVSWEFTPREDATDAQRWADFCNECKDDMSMSWADTTSSIFSMIPFGWSYHEIVYKYRRGPKIGRVGGQPSSDFNDGMIGWRKLAIRSQDSLVRWEFGEDGSLKGMWQSLVGLPGGNLRFIPIEKAALFRPQAFKDSPQGRSVLEGAVKPWWYKRRYEEFEGIGIERDLAGMAVGYVPSTWLSSKATPAQKESVREYERLLRNIRRNSKEGAILPRDFDSKGNPVFGFELLASPSRRPSGIDEAIGRKNQEIAMVALADFLLLGHENVGSRALGSSKIDLFITALETWTQEVCDVFNAHVTPRLLHLNGVPPDRTPLLTASPLSQTDLAEFSSALAALINSGAVTVDPPLEDYARETAGLPPREQGAEWQQPELEPVDAESAEVEVEAADEAVAPA